MAHDELLTYYVAPGVFTAVANFATQVDALANDVEAIARAVQGLLIHEALAPAYQVVLPDDRVGEKQLHSAEAMLACATRLNAQPITEARVPAQRVGGVCRHFATMFVAFMRHKGVPARARCGFANYFEPGKHVDHWVGEYWNASELRWVLVDAQIDDLQRRLFHLNIDTLDVPRDRFLVAGDAWRACRSGADPMTFGVAGTKMWGLVEVFGDVFQDLAALQNIELLPWGWYGLALDDSAVSDVELIDELARLSSTANANALTALRKMVDADERLRVPASTVEAIVAADRAGIAA